MNINLVLKALVYASQYQEQADPKEEEYQNSSHEHMSKQEGEKQQVEQGQAHESARNTASDASKQSHYIAQSGWFQRFADDRCEYAANPGQKERASANDYSIRPKRHLAHDGPIRLVPIVHHQEIGRNADEP